MACARGPLGALIVATYSDEVRKQGPNPRLGFGLCDLAFEIHCNSAATFKFLAGIAPALSSNDLVLNLR
jgi:hypothetical protein